MISLLNIEMSCGNESILYDTIPHMKRKEILNSTEMIAQTVAEIKLVGQQQPLRRWSLLVIAEECGIGSRYYIEVARKQGKIPLVFSEDKCGTRGGALYVADGEALQALLSRNSEELKKCGCPDTIDGFIEYVATKDIKPGTTIYTIVAQAFGRAS